MKGMAMRNGLVLAVLVGLAGCVAVEAPEKASDPSNDFAAYCSACHGSGGAGDGEMAGDLAKKPADLTRLAQRNNGDFPTTKVMAQIWGYAGMKGKGVMPNFGPLLEGDTVPYDGGDGIETPTPVRLVALAEYLKTLQVK